MIVVIDKHGVKHFLNPMHIAYVSVHSHEAAYVCMAGEEQAIVVPFETEEEQNDFLVEACMAVDALVWGAEVVLETEPEDENEEDIFEY